MRGERGDGKVGEIDQNGSPKAHIEREGRNPVRCGDRKTCLMEMKSAHVGRKNKSCPEL